MKRRVAICVLLSTSLWLAQIDASAGGQQLARSNSAPPVTTVSDSAEPAPGEYVIGPDDLLSVVFWRDQQLSGDVLVRPDGKISVPLLDDIQASGLTPRQLRDRLVGEARRFVADPVATVVVKQINSRKVYITGLVGKPGQYVLAPGMTVLQLIATAGGLQEYAKAKEILVVRVVGGKSIYFPFDYDETAKHPKEQKKTQNVELKPGDTVIVP